MDINKDKVLEENILAHNFYTNKEISNVYMGTFYTHMHTTNYVLSLISVMFE